MSESAQGDWSPEHITVNGRHVIPGVELSITGMGERRFRFISWDPRGWVNVWGGNARNLKMRAFDPERIGTVHRTVKMKVSPMPRAPRKVVL